MATDPYYTAERARQAAKYTLLFRIISGLAALVGSVLLVRLLSEEQYGVYNLLYALLPLTINVLSFGLDNSVSRYIPEFVKDGEFRLAKRLGHFAQLIRMATSAAVMIGLIIFWDYWSAWFRISEYSDIFIVFSALLMFLLQYRLLSTILSSYLLQKYSVGARASVAGVKTFGYATIWLLGGGLIHVLFLELGIYALITIILFIVQHTKIDHSKGQRSTLGQRSRRRIIRYAAFYNFNDVGTFVLGSRFDNFFLAAMLGPTAVGAYAMATTISNFSNRVGPVGFFETVIKPVFFSLDRETQAEDVTIHFQLMVKLGFIFGLPTTAFFAIFHSPIVSVVLAGKFQDYSYLIAVVSGFALVTRFGVVVSFIAQLAERAGIVLVSKIFIAYNVIAIIWLVPKYGVLGAAVATGTAVLFKEVFIWWHVRDLASLRGMGRFFPISFVFWIGFAVVSALIQSISLSPAIELLVGTLLFLVFVFVFVRLPLMSITEKEFLRRVLPDKVAAALSRVAII